MRFRETYFRAESISIFRKVKRCVHMQVLFNVILPVFAIILCGYLSGLFGVISKDGAKSLNNYVFYVTLPALLFYSVAKAPIEQLTNVAFISANLIGILASFLLSMFIAKLVFKKVFRFLRFTE